MKISIMKDADEGSPNEEAGESKKYEQHELDHGVDTLMKAEKMKQDPHFMKALAPHLEKHKNAAKKISSMKELRAKAKDRIKELGNEQEEPA